MIDTTNFLHTDLMSRKPSLSGRKRTGELGDNQAMVEKKQRLESLKQAADIAQKRDNPGLTAKSKNQSSHVQSDLLDGMAPAKQELEMLKRSILHVTPTVKKLAAYAHKLAKAGSLNRCQYSPCERRQLLVVQIQKLVGQHAEQLKKQGATIEENHEVCQKFVDKLRHQLVTLGINLNPLQVSRR